MGPHAEAFFPSYDHYIPACSVYLDDSEDDNVNDNRDDDETDDDDDDRNKKSLILWAKMVQWPGRDHGKLRSPTC